MGFGKVDFLAYFEIFQIKTSEPSHMWTDTQMHYNGHNLRVILSALDSIDRFAPQKHNRPKDSRLHSDVPRNMKVRTATTQSVTPLVVTV